MTDVEALELTKAHGTGNDFVVLTDREGTHDVDAAAVARLCDRHRGIGGDGLIRVVPVEHIDAPGIDQARAAGAQWFMDYRNSDGSIAEMCGNGVRVFAHYLFTEGLAPADEPLVLGTRGGVKTVTRVDPAPGERGPWYRVDMGTWRHSGTVVDGADALVTAKDAVVARPALSFDLGNPHTVVALARTEELLELDLTRPPHVEPEPANGTNVEFIVLDSADGADAEHGVLRMRVNERGVGETQACGTGACASALAARSWAGDAGPDSWFVDQPGGRVRVDIAGDTVFLNGPASIVARIRLDPEFISGV